MAIGVSLLLLLGWPRVWNSLPSELQQCESLKQFKRHLKIFFGYGTTALCDFC